MATATAPPAKHGPHWVTLRPGGHGDYVHVCIGCERGGPKTERHHSWPAVLEKDTLRGATDDELQAHFSHHDNPKTHRQVLGEMKRRDRAAAAKDRATSRKFERYEAVETAITAAESGTNGYFVNKKGRSAGISDWELFTGDARKAERYASDELLNWWSTHPRPTARNLKQELTARERDYRATDRFAARAH